MTTKHEQNFTDGISNHETADKFTMTCFHRELSQANNSLENFCLYLFYILQENNLHTLPVTITHKNTVLLKNTDCACENLKADSFVHVFPLKR